MLKQITKIFLIIFTLTIITSLAKAQDEPVGIVLKDGVLYGTEISPEVTAISVEELIKNQTDNNKKILVVNGDITEVCQEMGCWMVLSDGTNEVRVKTLHKFFLPKDIAGRKAVVMGKFKVTEIDEETARHYNEESKNKKEIKGQQKAYEINATGVKLLKTENDPGMVPQNKD